MTCGFPIDVGGKLRPCGKCQGCARKRRNSWVGRMLMEQTQHQESAFVTLTYNDENLPWAHNEENDLWIPTLVKSHCQKWIKSVRQKAMHLDRPLRYFAAGEYGTKGERKINPHYHIILFGTGPLWNKIYEESWKKGFVSSYAATPASMAYVAKYCLKGGQDPELHLPTSQPQSDPAENRATSPPFRLTSRRPAIGTTFAKNIATSLVTANPHGLLYDPSLQGPANQIQISKKNYPLDTTMKHHLETALYARGVNDEHINAMLNRDFPEATDEEIKKARGAHEKALRTRDTRLKL